MDFYVRAYNMARLHDMDQEALARANDKINELHNKAETLRYERDGYKQLTDECNNEKAELHGRIKEVICDNAAIRSERNELSRQNKDLIEEVAALRRGICNWRSLQNKVTHQWTQIMDL